MYPIALDSCWFVIIARASGLLHQGVFRKTCIIYGDRPRCWMEHMALDNETGLDPAGIRVRPVSGLVAADYFAPGYFVWAVLIENLSRLGYEEKNMYMAAYDWRLTFQNNEVSSYPSSLIAFVSFFSA